MNMRREQGEKKQKVKKNRCSEEGEGWNIVKRNEKESPKMRQDAKQNKKNGAEWIHWVEMIGGANKRESFYRSDR